MKSLKTLFITCALLLSPSLAFAQLGGQFGGSSGGPGGGSFTAGGDLSGTSSSQTVIGVNGAAVPTSSLVSGTNSSNQIVAATAANVATLIQGLAGCNTASYLFSPQANDCVAPAVGSTSGQAQYSIPVAATSSTLTTQVCTPPSINGQYTVGYTVTGSAALAPTCPQVGLAPRGVSGATDTLLYSDNNNVVIYEDNSGTAVTGPTPTSLTNSNFFALAKDKSTGNVTITPTTWTISLNGAAGGSSAVCYPQQTCALYVDPIASTQWDLDSVDAAGYVNGAKVPASATVAGTNSSNQIIAAALATGKWWAGASNLPVATFTPTLGVSGTAGTIAMFPASGNFTTTWGSAATASNTILGFATVPTTTDLIDCVVSSTTCTLTDTGVPNTSAGFLAKIGTVPIANGGTNATSAAAGTMPQASSSSASSWTLTPSLGVASTSTGTIELFNSGVAFGNIWASNSGATATNTIQGFIAVPTTNTVPKCVVASTTCTLTQSAIVDNGTTVSTTEAVTALSVATGTSPPTCAVGTSGTLCENEGTAPTGAASVDDLYANSTNHCLDAINNNTDVGCVAALGATETFTATQTVPNLAFSGSAPAVTASGTTPYINESAPLVQRTQCSFSLTTSTFTLALSPVNLCTLTLPNAAVVWRVNCQAGYSVTAGTTPTFAVGNNWAQTPSGVFGAANIDTTNAGVGVEGTTASTSNGNILATGSLTTAATIFTTTWWTTFTGSATSGAYHPTASLTGTSATGTLVGFCTIE